MGPFPHHRSLVLRGLVLPSLLALACEADGTAPPAAGSGTSTGATDGDESTTTTEVIADSTSSSSTGGEGSSSESDSGQADGGPTDPVPAFRVHLSGYSDVLPVGIPQHTLGTDGFILGLTVAGIDTTVTATLLATVGGPANDRIEGIVRSSSGIIHAVGCTSNPLFATPGAHQEQQGSTDGSFVAAYAPDGSTLAATYFGWGQPGCLTEIAAPDDGSVVVSALGGGGIEPTTPGSYQPTAAGSTELLGARLDGSLGTLQWATFLGGTGYEQLTTAATTTSGGWISALRTQSLDFPITGTPIVEGQPGALYSVLAQISGDGTTLEWSTALDFDDNEGVDAIEVLPDGDLLLCGSRYVDGSLNDAWIARVSPDASRLHASTTIGGAGDDICRALGVDASGHVFGLAEVRSADFPVTPGVLQPWSSERAEFPRDLAAFKLDPGLDRVVYSTFLGGDDNDWIGEAQLAITPEGDAFISFDTRSSNLPVTDNSQVEYLIATYGNSYLLRLSEDGRERRFATYFGQSDFGFTSGIHLTGITLTPLDPD